MMVAQLCIDPNTLSSRVTMTRPAVPDRYRSAVPAASSRPDVTGIFATLGRLCARKRWWVIGVWAAVLVTFGVFAPKLADELTPGGFEISGSTSEQARITILDRFGADYPTTLTAVVTMNDGVTDVTALNRVAGRVRAALSTDPLVGKVSEPLTGRDARRVFLVAGIRAGLDDALKESDRVIAAARSAATADVRVELTGAPAIFADFDAVNQTDLHRSEVIQVPIVLLILLLVLGSLIAASLPIIATFTALVVTLGALYFVARGADLSIYTQNIVPLVGIGVGVDYSLFLVRRFAEEMRAGRSTSDALAVAMHTSGRAIFFSGLTVVVALAGMFAVGVPIFTGFAIGSIAVVTVAMATGLTLVPAVLAALGQRIFRWNIGERLRPPAFRSRPTDVTRWSRWADRVMRRPWPYLLASTGLLAALAVPAIWLDLGSSGATALPRDVPSIRASDAVAGELGPGALAQVRVVVVGRSTPPSHVGVDALAAALRRDPAVTFVRAIKTSDDGTAQLIDVVPAFGEDTPEAQDLVTRIEQQIVPSTRSLGSARVVIGGAASQNRDFNETVAHNLPPVIALVMLLTFIVLVILFRSILLPLKAVVMTMLSVVASYGVLVMVFQWGWGDGLLGFTNLGHVTSWVPPFLFSILFGLSMDYEVFLLTRVREHYDMHGDDRAAVAWGLARTGGIITAAAAIMIVVFLSFLLNRLVPIKESSLGLAVAVFLDATIVRIVLVPAFMRIAGRWNWWLPRWLDRILPAPHAENRPSGD
jgi:RND superfamily putative drug exporter